MQGHRKRKSSSSSDEDLSLILAEKHGNDLYETKVFLCDFCDEAFLNRYNHLVHNATHIIIPLLKETYYKCKLCDLQCLSDGQLSNHMVKCPTITNFHHKIKLEITEESQVTINNNDNNLSIFNNSSNNNVESKFIKDNSVDLKKNFNDTFNINNAGGKGIEVFNNNDNRHETMRNRLVFEDDEDDIINPNGLIYDLTSDIKVTVPVEPWMSLTEDKKTVEEIDPELEEIWRTKTVSYQQLTKMKEVPCKYCNKTFPNRLSQLEHQNIHIAPKRRHPFLCAFCDWYVSSDPQTLRKHHKIKHPDKDIKDMQHIPRPSCKLCKLRYVSKQKHMKNYHSDLNWENKDDKPLDSTVTKLSDTKLLSDTQLSDNKPQFIRRITKVCDFCFSFLKNIPNNVYYKIMGEESISGKRQTCARCMKQYFSINLVEISSKPKFMGHCGQKKAKSISNVERLKNFKNRLKLLNTIRKFLLLFYFDCKLL